MGDLILLEDLRAARRAESATPRQRPGGHPPITFAFEPGSPWTYLAAERVERRFAGVRWLPVAGSPLGLEPPSDGDVARLAVERRAAELALPLVWPERGPATGPGVARVATLAARGGHAAPFVLAAGRLAYCGGYDLDDPAVLAEAAAAGGLDPARALEAACEAAHDAAPLRAAARLTRCGAAALPVLRVGRTLFCGERRIAEASALLAAGRASG
ncbi:MAG TPA: hypothetical protein VLA98_06980 [Solirubrobacteraceae bacterium]|nr:hypothetical protein [Solirubrobacteraceae bacterium]